MDIELFATVCNREDWARDGNAAVVPLPGGRRQRVLADLFEEGGDEILRLRSHIGSAAVLNEARLQSALRINARLRFGAIAIDGDMLAVVDTLLLREAEADELRASMLYLAQKADELERGLFGEDRQ